MQSLKTTLAIIRKELEEKDKIRERAQQHTRKATSLSKQAILLGHQRKMREARVHLGRAKEILSKLDSLSAEYPQIIYSGSLDAALEEYSEANIFLTLIQESRFVTPNELKVPSTSYVLGLADVIGELRRLTLDSLREGDLRKAERHLKTMDETQTELMALDEAYMLVPGLRRKNDVARKLIEITRGDVTQEVRRNILEVHLKRFERATRRKQKHS